jgi:hypothetical protein
MGQAVGQANGTKGRELITNTNPQFTANQDRAGPIQCAAAECETYEAISKPSSRVRCDIESG